MSVSSSMPRRKPPPPPPPPPTAAEPDPARGRRTAGRTPPSSPPFVVPKPMVYTRIAPVGRLLRRVERQRPGVARAVGQQHDDARARRRPSGPAPARFRPSVSVTAARHARIDVRDRVDRLEDAAADGRPTAGRQAPDGIEEQLLVGGRRLDDLAEAGNATIPIWLRRRFPLDEAPRPRPRPPGGASAGCRWSTCCRDTSIVRMIVRSPLGTARMAAGRAIANASTAEGDERTGRTAGGAGSAMSEVRRRGSARGSNTGPPTGRRRRSAQM